MMLFIGKFLCKLPRNAHLHIHMHIPFPHHRVGVIMMGPEPSVPRRFPSDVKRFLPSMLLLLLLLLLLL